MRNLKPLTFFLFLFLVPVALEIDVIGPVGGKKKKCLQAHSCTIQPGNFTGWGSEGLKFIAFGVPKLSVKKLASDVLNDS